MSDRKTLLITGWLGYIWSHAVVAFEQAWYKTVIIDNLSNSSKDVLHWINSILWYTPDFFECSIEDESLLAQIFEKYNLQWVIHFAWLKAFGESVIYPDRYYQNNIVWSLSLLRVMDLFGVSDIIFSSSASVYAEINEPPFTEDMVLSTTNPYATSKLAIEYILKDYAKHKNFRVALLRYFNLVGAHPTGYLWDFPVWRHGSLSTNIFDVVYGKKTKLFIYGDDFQTPDGTAIRDYIDVCDLVEGHLRAFEYIRKSSFGTCESWNLGTGKGTSVKELISMIEQVTWKTIATEVLSRRTIDLASPISNPGKAKRDLDWSSKISLKDSIESVWGFLEKRLQPLNLVKKKKRVAHFSPYALPHSGWIENYVNDWSTEYVNEWWSCLLVAFSVWQKAWAKKPKWVDLIILPAFDLVKGFPFPAFWDPRFWRGLWKIKKWNPDIIHTHTRFFFSSWIGGICAMLWEKSWVHIEHGSGSVVSGSSMIRFFSRLVDRSIGNWVMHTAHQVVTVSEACEHFVRDVFGVKKARTIYRGISQIEIKPREVTSPVCIGFVGRLVDLKGVDFLLSWYAKFLQTTKTSTILRIVWNGPERKRLEKLSEKLSIVGSVEFLWERDHDEVMKVLMPSWDIFINPSLQEWLPTTVMEAISLGLSIIATDVWGTRELINFSQDIRLIPPRQDYAIAESLRLAVSEIWKKSINPSPWIFLWNQTFREFTFLYHELDK
jgi:UDP-glucose 4-epimerase